MFAMLTQSYVKYQQHLIKGDQLPSVPSVAETWLASACVCCARGDVRGQGQGAAGGARPLANSAADLPSPA